MRRSMMVLMTLAEAFALLLPVSSQALPGTRRGTGWMYNPRTVQTLKGIVVSVEKVAPRRGAWNYTGIHIRLKTQKETISVHLGPSWYLDKQSVQIRARDRVKVKGSRVTYQGKPILIAAAVTKGGRTLLLRDKNGVPVWARQGGGRAAGRGRGRGAGMGRGNGMGPNRN